MVSYDFKTGSEAMVIPTRVAARDRECIRL